VSTASYWPRPDSTAAFVAGNAVVMGWVKLAEVNIWYGAVCGGMWSGLKLENARISKMERLHGDPGKPTILEDHVTVGHRAVVHSAYIERGA